MSVVPPFSPQYIEPGALTTRRMLVATLVVLGTGTAGLLMFDLLGMMPQSGWSWVLGGLFVVLFGLIAFGASQAAIGFFLRRRGGDPWQIDHSLPADDSITPLAPTAVILPVYNEDVTRVYAGLAAIYESIQRTGQLEHFDFFILSDSNKLGQWVEEEMGWVDLMRRLGAQGRIHYRRRRVNTNKKAGNVADFCRRWGRNFRYMLVLDADSIMTGDTIVRMVRLAETNPRVGILQTAPRLARARTRFARIMQFSTRLYGPMFLGGLNYWQQSEGNYWGHNALIRLAPFIEHCALPKLPGREPFGGKILSHDFVEAALMRKAGWATWLVPGLEGSFEEGPPTLLDSAIRDRRWCQGNLQHTWLLFAEGLHGVNRLHMILGIFSYAGSLLWMLSLVLGTMLALSFEATGLSFVPTPGIATALGVPTAWEAGTLFGLTMMLLFAPKVLALIDLSLTPGGPAKFGGMRRAAVSAGLESAFSVVLAPILMCFHTTFVISTLLGRGASWNTQNRDGDGTSWTAAWAAHRAHLLIGLVWLAALLRFAPELVPWMAPVLLGLLGAIPFSVWTSRRGHPGSLFQTPDTTARPVEIQAVDQAVAGAIAPAWPPALEPERGLVRVLIDPYANAIHRCLQHDRGTRSPEIDRSFVQLRNRLVNEGPDALTGKQKQSLTTDPQSLDWLHRELWLRHGTALHPWWREARRWVRAHPLAYQSGVPAKS